MERLNQLLQDIEDGHDLAHYAALAAAKELAQNWCAALRDGNVLAKMAQEDVNETIRILEKFRDSLKNVPYAD